LVSVEVIFLVRGFVPFALGFVPSALVDFLGFYLDSLLFNPPTNMHIGIKSIYSSPQ
jgi:hypothetical protein